MAENDDDLEGSVHDAFDSYSDMFPQEDYIGMGGKLAGELTTILDEIGAGRYNPTLQRSEPYYVRNRSGDRNKTMIVNPDGIEEESPLSMESFVALYEVISSGDVEPTEENLGEILKDLALSEQIEAAEIDSITASGFQIEVEAVYENINFPGRMELINAEVELVYNNLEQRIKEYCRSNNMICYMEDESYTYNEESKLVAWLFTFQRPSNDEP